MNPPTMEITRKSCKFSHPATEHDAELSYKLQPIPETGPSQSDILKENSPAPTIIVDPPTPIETTKPPKPKIHNNISHAPKCSCIRQPIPLHYVSERSCIYQPIPETDRSESDILQQYSPVPTIVVHPPTTTENMKSFKLKPRNNIRHVPECSCIRKPIPTNNQVSERSSCILQPIPEVPPVQDLWKEIKNPTTSNYELRELQKLMKQREAMILREMQTLRKSMVMQRLIEVEELRKVEDSWSNKDDGPWICAESRNLITASAKSTKHTKYTKYTKSTNFTISEHPVKSVRIQEPVVSTEPMFRWKKSRLNQICLVLLGSMYLLWFSGLFMTIAWNLIYRTRGYWAGVEEIIEIPTPTVPPETPDVYDEMTDTAWQTLNVLWPKVSSAVLWTIGCGIGKLCT